jgi:hypothetical protein
MSDCDGKDAFRPLCPLPGGRTLVVRHRADHSQSLEVGRPARDGQPLQPGEEYVSTKRRDDGSFEVVESFTRGPAQVATKSYRDGWERTFTARGGEA